MASPSNEFVLFVTEDNACKSESFANFYCVCVNSLIFICTECERGVINTYIYRSLLRLGSYYQLDPPTKDTLLNRIPELMSLALHQKISAYIPFRSVETPVEYSPLEATAKEPPRSTESKNIYQCASTEYHTSVTYPWKQLYPHEVCRVYSANSH